MLSRFRLVVIVCGVDLSTNELVDLDSVHASSFVLGAATQVLTIARALLPAVRSRPLRTRWLSSHSNPPGVVPGQMVHPAFIQKQLRLLDVRRLEM